MTTNKQMAELYRAYGPHITVDYFYPDSWRVWIHGWHYHWSSGASHGSFTGRGRSIDQAIAQIKARARKIAPNEGDHCEESCPHYEPDLY